MPYPAGLSMRRATYWWIVRGLDVTGNTKEGRAIDDAHNLLPAGAADPVSRRRRRSPDPQWDVTVAVIIGGVIGAEARYGLSLALPHAESAFPWSTLLTNVVGSFCLGLLMSLLSQLSSPHRLVRPLIGVGVLGGFTTFSTFTVDVERLIEHHQAAVAGLYVLGTLLAAGVAMALGTITAQLGVRHTHRRRRRRTGTPSSQQYSPATRSSRRSH